VGEQTHLNKIREAQMKQQRIYQEHLQRFVLPQSLDKIMNEAKINNGIDTDYQ
jgi:hypothetical protein